MRLVVLGVQAKPRRGPMLLLSSGTLLVSSPAARSCASGFRTVGCAIFWKS